MCVCLNANTCGNIPALEGSVCVCVCCCCIKGLVESSKRYLPPINVFGPFSHFNKKDDIELCARSEYDDITNWQKIGSDISVQWLSANSGWWLSHDSNICFMHHAGLCLCQLYFIFKWLCTACWCLRCVLLLVYFVYKIRWFTPNSSDSSCTKLCTIILVGIVNDMWYANNSYFDARRETATAAYRHLSNSDFCVFLHHERFDGPTLNLTFDSSDAHVDVAESSMLFIQRSALPQNPRFVVGGNISISSANFSSANINWNVIIWTAIARKSIKRRVEPQPFNVASECQPFGECSPLNAEWCAVCVQRWRYGRRD